MDHIAELRHKLVSQLSEQLGGLSRPVEAALRAVPRHVFVPDVPVEQAYRDEAVVTRRDVNGVPLSSSSQPAIVAIMLDQLDVRHGQRVLEIGAGTGYNAALLGHLVGAGGEVVTLDIDPDVVAMARANLAAAVVTNVTAVCAGGVDGWAKSAPYDRIIATVGVWDLAPAWHAQLAPAGRIVVPLDLRGVQLSIAFDRADGHWESRSVRPCGFMRLRGAGAGPEQVLPLEPAGTLLLMVPDGRVVDETAVRVATAQLPVVRATGVRVAAEAVFGGLRLWLATADRRVCYLFGEGSAAPILERAPIVTPNSRATAGLLEGPSLTVLSRGEADAHSEESFELEINGFGPDGARLATELEALVRAWGAAGRPTTEGLHVAAYPRDTSGLEGLVIDKAHTRLVLTRS